MDKREKLAREMMLYAEQKFGSARGRELLGFQTLEGFIDDGWRNYLPYVDIALADGPKPAVDLEAVNRALGVTVRKQEAELKAADAQIRRLRAVLEPFAKAADGFDSYNIKDPEEWYAYSGVSTRHNTTGAITVGDLRRARTALTEGGE